MAKHGLFAGKRTISIGVVGALLLAVLVPVQFAIGPASPAAADPPAPAYPSMVSLSSSSSSFAAGDHATLTATTDESLAPSASVLSITDETTSVVLASCTTGTTCTANASFSTGGPHTYIASVNALSSNEVEVSRATWTVSLGTDKTSFDAGESVTFTAAANQSVSGTSGKYQIAIYDKTTDAMVQSCTTSDTCTYTAVPFTHGAAHTYVAGVISTTGSTSYSGRSDVQALSNEIVVSRTAWSITLATDTTDFVAGGSVTFTATANQNVSNSGGWYMIMIFDTTTGGAVKTCSTGAVCEYTSTDMFTSGAPHSYAAVVALIGGSYYYPTQAGIEATSNVVEVARAAWAVTLTSDATTFLPGQTVTWTATANQNLSSTGYTYAIYIFDETTGGVIKACIAGTTCTLSSSYNFTSGGPHTYVAQVAKYNSSEYPAYGAALDVQAISNEVSLTRAPWTVALSIDQTVIASDGYATVTASANQSVTNTGGQYAIYIYDVTTGSAVAGCTSGSTCSVPVGFQEGGPHTFRAEVSKRDWYLSAYGDSTDVQAVSNDVYLTRLSWQVAITNITSAIVPWAPEVTTFTFGVTTNQSVTASPWQVVVWDQTLGHPIGSCDGIRYCTVQDSVYGADPPHVYVAYVAHFSFWDYSMWDIQGASAGVLADNEHVVASESQGGANAAEKDCGCDHGDPISSSNGEFYLPATDLALPGSGPALSISRTYSAMSAASDGPFGYGWSSSFGAHLATVIAGDTTDPLPRSVRITQENGATVDFYEGPDQTYLAAARVMATLSWDPLAERWLFTRHDSETLTFDSGGALVALHDLHSSAITFAHSGGVPVSSISGTGDRSIDLSWSGGRVTGLEDSAGRTVSYAYDSNGNLTSATSVDGSVTHYAYDSAHYMTSLTKPGGLTTTNVYDSSHRVTSQTDPLDRETTFSYSGTTTTVTAPDGSVTVEVYVDGRLQSQTRASGTAIAATTSYTYDIANNITSVTDPLGHVTTMTYNAYGDVLTSTDPLGRVTTWVYNSLHKPISTTDPMGHVTTATYTVAGDVLSTTSPTLRVQSFTYNSDGTPATSVNALGKTTAFDYDDAGRLTETTDADGHVTSLVYNAAGLVTSVTAPGGGETVMTVDAAGRVLTSTDPNSHVTTFGYDSAGNRTTVTDANDNVSTSVFDDAGQLITATDATGGVTHYTYTLAGQPATVTDPNRHTTTVAYNELGQRVSVTDANSHVTAYTYDGDGHPLTTTLPSTAVTSVTYDVAGQVTTATDANGKISHFAYNLNGQLTSSTDPLSRVTSTAYTADGEASTITLPDSSTQVYVNDAAGRRTSFTNADGKATTYTYSDSGLQLGKSEPGGLDTSYSYDSAGRLNVVTLPDASTIGHSYDAAGQLTGVNYSASGSTDTAYVYDGAGRLTSMTDASGTTSYVYDAAGRLTKETNGAAATTSYAYDDAGQLTKITYPGHRDVDYVYDPVGQMTSLTDWQAKTTAFTWTANGQLATQVDANGVTQTNTYDAAGQTTSIVDASTAATLGTFGYSYDDAGQLVTDLGTFGLTSTGHDYGYDPLSQVTTVATSIDAGTPTSAAYDATSAGLLTANTAGATLAYNAAQQLTSVTPATGPATSFAYDGRGSRTSSTVAADGLTPAHTTSYTYTASGALASVVTPTTTIGYTSNAQGLRQSRTVGSATKQFTWSSVGGLPLLLDDGDHSYIYGPSSTPIAQVDDSTNDVEYLHGDLLGSTRLITDDSAAIVGANTFDEYGTRTPHTGTADSAIGYTGNWTDPDTGLLYLRARDYDPATGQFLAVDPAVDATAQPYAYAGNDPLLKTDPTGLCFGDGIPNCRPEDFGGSSAWLGPVADMVALGTYDSPLGHLAWGIGDGATFGGVSDMMYALNGQCMNSKHDPFYWGGVVLGVALITVLSLGTADVAGGANRLSRMQEAEDDAARFVSTKQGLIDTASDKLKGQVDRVVGSMRTTGSPPSGVRQGQMQGVDKGVFANTENKLPSKPLGYYHESDVWPGSGSRGTERVVVGAGGEAWYTPDHYGTFRVVK